MHTSNFILLFSFICVCSFTSEATTSTTTSQTDDILITILIRNKAHTLPYFLYYLENLLYPKEHILLWIRSDHNVDNSSAIVQDWIDHVEYQYKKIDFVIENVGQGYEDETGECHWSRQRFKRVINLKEEAIHTARSLSVRYLLFLDADNLLTNSDTLNRLIAQRRTIVAPMLNVTASSFYSNFWCGMDKDYYYRRTQDYMPTLHRHRQGCFAVPLVHSTVLIDLTASGANQLSVASPYDGYNGPVDDIIMLALSAKHHGVDMHILNDDMFGYGLVPMEQHHALQHEIDQFIHMKLENVVYDEPLQLIPYLAPKLVPKTKLGFDQVYLINLLRRPDRRAKMQASFDELGIDVKLVEASDGRQLNASVLDSLGARVLDGYLDPYHKRNMKMGEIGCFLSHYFIWQDVVENSYSSVLLFEDDIHFEVYFKDKLAAVMQDLSDLDIEWDLIYLGRKQMDKKRETYLRGSSRIVWPSYSYWTLSYALSYSGALKLLDQQPLQKMMPVDEYLPVMFDEHPNKEWLSAFEPRDLVALSTYPLLVYPTHYTGEPGYVTDTEDSVVLDEDQHDHSSADDSTDTPQLHTQQPGEQLLGDIGATGAHVDDEL